MTDAERLDQMAAAVRTILAADDPAGNRWSIDRASRTLVVLSSVVESGQAAWALSVHAPWETVDFRFPARVVLSGSFTPLCREVVAALDALMWEDWEG